MINYPYLNSINNQFKFCFSNWETWYYTSWSDLVSKYKRTKLGLGWNVLAMLITISIMSFVWSKIFKMDMVVFFPYIFNGFAAFFLLNSSITSSCILLSQIHKDIYLNLPLPFMVLILRNIGQHFFNYIHYLPIIFFLHFLLLDFSILSISLYLLGVVFLIIHATLLSAIFCVISTRYRDVYPLVVSVMSAATLLTPIMWNKEMLGANANYAYLNPFTFIIEVVRDPILNNIPGIEVYLLNIIFLIICYFVLHLILKFKGDRLIYWI